MRKKWLVILMACSMFLLSCNNINMSVDEDTSLPTLTITSANPASIKMGQSYVLSYSVDKATLGVEIVPSGGAFDKETMMFTPSSTGVTTLVVTAKNPNGNTVRTVKIIVSAADNPVYSIEFSQHPNLTVSVGSKLLLPQATATSTIASMDISNLSARIIDSENALELISPGLYKLVAIQSDIVTVVYELKVNNVTVKVANLLIYVTEQVSNIEAYDTLKVSPYSNNISTASNIGLNDVRNVGVSKTEAEKERYPVGSGTIYDVSEHGITTTSTDNIREINTLIASLKNITGNKIIRFGEGVYKISNPILITGIDNLTITGLGKGVEFLMNSFNSVIIANGCKKLLLHNVSLEFVNPSAISGTVVSTTSNSVTFDAEDEFDMTASCYNVTRINKGSYMEYELVGGKQIPKYNGNLLYNSTDGLTNISSYALSGKRVTVGLNGKKAGFPTNGSKVSLAYTMYEHAGVYIDNCENVKIENMNIYSAAGMGLTVEKTNNLYVNKLFVAIKDGSKRLMTATADGFHCKGITGDLVLTGSIIENTHDDAVNIASFYKVVTSANSSLGSISMLAAFSNNDYDIRVGDKLEIFDPKSVLSVAMVTVSSVTKQGNIWTIETDDIFPSGITNFIVANDTQTPKVLIENNIFRNKRNRGIIVQIRRSEIKNCTFSNVLHGAIQIVAVRNSGFSEAIVPRDLKISNCKFIDNSTDGHNVRDIAVLAWGSSSTTTDTITGILIENNAFLNSKGNAIYFQGCVGIAKNNLFYNVSRLIGSNRYAVRSIQSKSIELIDNHSVKMLSDDYYSFSNKDGISIVVESGTTHNSV